MSGGADSGRRMRVRQMVVLQRRGIGTSTPSCLSRNSHETDKHIDSDSGASSKVRSKLKVPLINHRDQCATCSDETNAAGQSEGSLGLAGLGVVRRGAVW